MCERVFSSQVNPAGRGLRWSSWGRRPTDLARAPPCPPCSPRRFFFHDARSQEHNRDRIRFDHSTVRFRLPDTSRPTANAIGYGEFYSLSHDAVIWVYDAAGNVVETHEHNCISKSASSDLKNTPNAPVCVFCSAVVRDSFKSANLSDAGTGRDENRSRRMHVNPTSDTILGSSATITGTSRWPRAAATPAPSP